MGATPLKEVHLPDRALAKLATIEANEWIDNHTITVNRPWWAQTLSEYGFEDTLVGDDISRADLFELASNAGADASAALTLLWNALAWGTGMRNRNNKRRIASMAADPVRFGDLLRDAAAISRADPTAAYELLYPRHRGAIRFLGPAFFTKYLYFAGGGGGDHPCMILDQFVAKALHSTCGWTSLPVNGGWLASAYGRYNELLGMWVEQHAEIRRRDVIERWLFEEGKRAL